MSDGGPAERAPADRSPVVHGFDQLREIGRGGSSTVYAARQEQLGRDVAIKVLHVALTDDDARRRFERECAVLGSLGDAPGIVPVFGTAFTTDGRGCIVMRLMRGTVADRLRDHGPLSAAEVRDVGVAACAALGHAHAAGVVHRDVKPANLLVSTWNEVALGDFDIAAVGAWSSSTLTDDSLSPPHAPPERLSGQGAGDAAGDVWSLGSTLHTLLTGTPPFGTATSEGGMAGLIDRVLHDDAAPIVRSDVPDALLAVISRALRKDPAERWPDAASMRIALLSVDGGDGDALPGALTAESAVSSGSRSAGVARVPRAATTAVVVIAVLVALLIAVLIAVG